jgi:hypothetical protein
MVRRSILFVELSLVSALAGGCSHGTKAPAVGTTRTTAATPVPSVTPEPVEGRLVMAVGGRDGTTVRYETNGEQTRVVLSSSDERPRLDVILDRSRGLADLLLDERKSYVTLDLDSLGHSALAKGASIGVVRTGQGKTVAGHPCEEWTISAGERVVRACVVTGAPRVDLGAIEWAVAYDGPGWLRTLLAEGAIPLRVEILEGDDRTLCTEMELFYGRTSFKVPSDYAKLALFADGR